MAGARQQACGRARATLEAIEQRFGVPPNDRACDLGPRDRVRRLQAAARRHPRACDAGLDRPAQGHVPRRVPRRAEDAADRHSRARRCAAPGRGAMGLTQFLPSENLQVCGRPRRRRPRRYLDIRCRMRWPRPPSSFTARAGSPASAGPTRCACRATSTAPSPSRTTCAARRMAQARLCAGLWTQARCRRTRRERLAADAGRRLRTGVPDPEELLRHQGLQFLRPLRAVRRSLERAHRRSARPFETPWSPVRAAAHHDVEDMQDGFPRSASTATRSTARPACGRGSRSAPTRRPTA